MSKAQKPPRFMKIYNFAMEVYDFPGAGIGCWRSCGQQEWELVSPEVILQLLFSTAPSLNRRNTSFFSFLCFCGALFGWADSLCLEFSKCSCMRRLGVCAMFTWMHLWENMCENWEIITVKWKDYFDYVTRTKGDFFKDCQRAESSPPEWHTHWEWWIINKGKGTMFFCCCCYHTRPGVHKNPHLQKWQSKTSLVIFFINDVCRLLTPKMLRGTIAYPLPKWID